MQGSDHYLFPGKDQAKRFGKILNRVLQAHEDEVSQLGYRVSDIGTHSIRKGAVSYMSSLAGGPPSAAICIRAGWTMGKVKDIYMRYVTSGDQFVGRTLSLLPILKSDFGSSPPHFIDHDISWVEEFRAAQFPMLRLVAGFGRFTIMCLASILYHRHWLRSYLNCYHIFLVTCNCF